MVTVRVPVGSPVPDAAGEAPAPGGTGPDGGGVAAPGAGDGVSLPTALRHASRHSLANSPMVFPTLLPRLLPTLEGGMVPKIESSVTALDAGVRQAHILDGRLQHPLLLEIFTPEGIGTMLTHDDWEPIHVR